MKQGFSLLLALLLLLTACGKTPAEPAEETFPVYFAAATVGSAALLSEERPLPPGTEPVEGLMRMILSGPVSEGLLSPIPAGTQLLSWEMEEDGVLRVDLSERYGGLAGVDLTLADYAIALTLCALPEVDAVSITVEGEPVSFRDHQVLRTTDVILSGSEDTPVTLTAPLYFPQPDGGLGMENRDLLITENDNLATVLLTALLSGPTQPGLYLPMPKGAELLSAYVEDGVCYANFSTPFLRDAPQDRRACTLLLYSIVNTLCAHDSISSVHLLVDGTSLESYGGIPTAAPLESNLALVTEALS